MGHKINTQEILKSAADTTNYVDLIEGEPNAAWLRGRVTAKILHIDTGRRRGKKSVSPSVILELSLTNDDQLAIIKFGYPGTTLKENEAVSLIDIEFRVKWKLDDPL